MKKLFIALVAMAAILAFACTQKPKEFVYMGQLYGSWNYGQQEKIFGKVKEFKQTHYWAEVADGKIIKGKGITTEDRKTTVLGNDFSQTFNEAGAALSFRSVDENGKAITDIRATAEGKFIRKAEYFNADTLAGIGLHQYEGDVLVRIDGYMPRNDTIQLNIKFESDADGHLKKMQYYNKKNEPQGYTIFERNENGQVVKFQSFNATGTMTNQTEYTYNGKGNRISQHEQVFGTNARVTDYTYQFEFDKMGNYTAIIFLKEGKPFIYRAREITYYE
ncbi:MAG: hypothetical protein NT092_14375 [Bacteroidia bacterium]|nr:hypothetical protein [Bacteroidia bacterium]